MCIMSVTENSSYKLKLNKQNCVHANKFSRTPMMVYGVVK